VNNTSVTTTTTTTTSFWIQVVIDLFINGNSSPRINGVIDVVVREWSWHSWWLLLRVEVGDHVIDLVSGEPFTFLIPERNSVGSPFRIFHDTLQIP
jgi:hypothetical protein